MQINLKNLLTIAVRRCKILPMQSSILQLKKVLNMSTSTINYTPEMIAVLTAAAPINHEKAQALAVQLDRGVRSIIAKCKREGFEYVSKPAPAKKKSAPSKVDLVAAICKGLSIDDCEGLEKATGAALNKLLSSLA